MKKFEKLYDQLGKFLHADNPWGSDKNLFNFLLQIPNYIAEIESLLELYFTVIRSKDFNGVWLIEVDVEAITIKISVACANNEFIIL